MGIKGLKQQKWPSVSLEVIGNHAIDRQYMVSYTIGEILSIISNNLKMSHDHDHDHMRDCLSIQKLILHMANHCTKFKVYSISCSRDTLGGGL